MADARKELISRVFRSFVREQRHKTVAEILNAEGYRTANGAMFTGQAISRILRNKQHLENRLVSRELWDQCREILAAKKRSGSTRRVAHLCSGLLKCGCGQTMYVPTNSKKYVCSKCRFKIAKDDIESILLEKLRHSDIPDIDKGISVWSSLSLAEQREIIESCVERIVAEDKKVTVSLFAFG